MSTTAVSAFSLLTGRALLPPGRKGAGASLFGGSLVLCSVLLNILGLLLPLATLHLYDRVLPNAATETLYTLVFGLLAIIVVELVLRRLQSDVIVAVSGKAARDLRQNALHNVLKGPRALDPVDGTTLIERLGAIDRLAAFYGGSSCLAVIEVPFVVIAIALIYLLAGPLALVPTGTLLVYFIVSGLLSRALRHHLREQSQSHRRFHDFLSETFRLIVTLKSWGFENVMMRRFERLLRSGRGTHASIVLLNGAIQRLSGVVSQLVIVLTMAVGAYLAIGGQITVGAVAASTLLAGRAVQPAMRVSRAWNEIQRATVAAEEVRDLFDRKGSPTGKPLVPKSTEAPNVILGNSAIAPGSIAVLSQGASAPKTALLEGLAGLRDPKSLPTPCLVGGVDPVAFRLACARGVILVQGAPIAFQGTLIENLTLFGRGPKAAEAIAWAEKLSFDRDVNALTRGYSTRVGVGASEVVSPTLLYKLALVRAFAMSPKLLLIEDPAAHLSSEDVPNLAAALSEVRGGCTIVVATDAPELVTMCDQALVVPGLERAARRKGKGA